LGKTGKNIREIFQYASENNVVLFLDEVDTIAKHRDDHQDSGELKRVVTVFLQNLDMLSTNSLVVGATNHEDLLDKAIWRRFPFRLHMNPLEHRYRRKLIEVLVKKYSSNIDTQLITSLTTGMNGSAIKELIHDAARDAIIHRRELATEDLVRSLLIHSTTKNKKGVRTHWGDSMYNAANILYESGFSLRDIEKISGIPYTTLRGRMGK
jgi:SpoVK/Ycf46/Vps4 family AAA+-type ATPase